MSPYGLFYGEYYLVPTVVLHQENNARYLATYHHCLSQHFLLYCAQCTNPSSRDVPFGNILILLASLFTRFFRLYDGLAALALFQAWIWVVGGIGKFLISLGVRNIFDTKGTWSGGMLRFWSAVCVVALL